MTKWPVQEAKTHFSELMDQACRAGPQVVTRHGTARVVVLSVEDYEALTEHKPSFKAFLLGGPKVDNFDIERDVDLGRSIAF